MQTLKKNICRRLQIDNFRFVEIESKKRVIPEQAKSLRRYLMNHNKVRFEKTNQFFDQFLDTPDLKLLKIGASLRIRYKGAGSRIYLQYKGPGFLEDGILYRSEFSSGKLTGILLEESHHDIIRFSSTTIKKIITKLIPKSMERAMRLHLGPKVLSNISHGPIISIYKKDKFSLNLGKVFLEPSLDRVFAFQITKKGLHPLSVFWELENEIKTGANSLNAKLAYIPQMREFDAMLAEKFDLIPEPLDKYHRCGSIFLPPKSRHRKK